MASSISLARVLLSLPAWVFAIAGLVYLAIGVAAAARLSIPLGAVMLASPPAVLLAIRLRAPELVRLARALRRSLPRDRGTFFLEGLGARAEIALDAQGVPSISARSREDAYAALGFIVARDRLFQLELLRRRASGRLAELFGPPALDLDVEARRMDLPRAAIALFAQLAPEERVVLESYARGINAYAISREAPAFELALLEEKFEPWLASDSVLLMLSVYHQLSADEATLRMRAILSAALPQSIVELLTPERDHFSEPPFHAPLPIDALLPFYEKESRGRERPERAPPWGSNGFVLSGARTRSGGALLACDIHLELTVPNVLYRAQLEYDGVRVHGVTIPGLPAILAGGNGAIAWGVTNLPENCLSLRMIDPSDPASAGAGEAAIDREERFAVRGGPSFKKTFRSYGGAPLAAKSLFGRPVAIASSARKPGAMNLALLELDRATGVDEALAVIDRFRGPALNFLLAGRDGRIAWTLGGPDLEDRPQAIDPPEGSIASANDRMRTAGAFPELGQHPASAHRAHRIRERLREGVDRTWTEDQLFEVAFETRIALYDDYRDRALEALQHLPEERELERVLRAWDGCANADSIGLSVLIAFREQLAAELLEPLFAACRAADPSFVYTWSIYDPAVRALLAARDPRLLPAPHASWEALIASALLAAKDRVLEDLQRLDAPWGEHHRAAIRHPMSAASPLLAALLDMPADALPGCSDSVRAASPSWGSVVRFAVDPGAIDRGLIHLPGGQSGHPLSPHYRDQHAAWLEGRPFSFAGSAPKSVLQLIPKSGESS